MSESIYLQGSEDVRSAGNTMREAAGAMKEAASSIDWSLQQHRNFMDDWLQRLEFILKESQSKESQP